VAFHNLPANDQTNAGTRVLCPGAQALKDDKDTLGILAIKAYTVVAHREDPFISFLLG